MIRQIDNFTKEKLEELVSFGGGNSSEMMAEVVKEVANRFVFKTDEDGDWLSGKTGVLGRCLFKVKVTIQGWDKDTFEMGGEDHLKELNSVAQAVGTKFTIKEVKTYRTLAPSHIAMETFKMVAALVDQQEEKVDRLELSAVEVWQSSTLVQTFIARVKSGPFRV